MLVKQDKKGGINGQENLHSGANHQDDVDTTSESSTGMVPVISTFETNLPEKDAQKKPSVPLIGLVFCGFTQGG